MDNLDEFYRSYGESLASRLAAINHSLATPAFVFVSDIDDPIEVMSFTGSNKSATAGPILVWDNFGESLSSSGRDNYHLPLEGSFSILRKAVDKSARLSAHVECRKIALKVIALMLRDAEEGILLESGIQLSVREFPMEKVGPASTSWYGYGVQFNWLAPVEVSLGEADLL